MFPNLLNFGNRLAISLFFFFESEFVFRGAYNGVQRRSRNYNVLCLGVEGESWAQRELGIGGSKRYDKRWS